MARVVNWPSNQDSVRSINKNMSAQDDYARGPVTEHEIELRRNEEKIRHEKNQKTLRDLAAKGIKIGYYSNNYYLAQIESIQPNYYGEGVHKFVVYYVGELREGTKGFFSSSETKFKCYDKKEKMITETTYDKQAQINQQKQVEKLVATYNYVGNKLKETPGSGIYDKINNKHNCNPYFEGANSSPTEPLLSSPRSPMLSQSPMSGGGRRRNPMLHLKVHRLMRHSRKSSSRRRNSRSRRSSRR